MIKMWDLRFCLKACNRLTLCPPTQGKRKDGNFCKRNASKCRCNFSAPWQFSCIEKFQQRFYKQRRATGATVYRTIANVKWLTAKDSDCFR